MDVAKLSAYRIMAYDPFGAPRGVIPEVSDLEVNYLFNGLPTATIKIPPKTLSAQRLQTPCEFALEIRKNGTWTEPPNSRFISTKTESDIVNDKQIITVRGLGFGQALRWATIWTPTPGDADFKRVFTAKTPGAIMHELFVAAMERIDSAGRTWTKNTFTFNFTTTHDSHKQPWGKKAAPTFNPSDPLEKAVDWLATKGAIDYEFHGRTLNAYRAETGKFSPNNPTKQTLNPHFATAQPITTSYEKLTTVAVFHGNSDFLRKKENPDASSSLGRIERWSEQGQVNRASTADLYLDSLLQAGKTPATQWRREYTDDGHTPVLHADYSVGEWVSIGDEKLQIVEAGLHWSSDNKITGWETLGTRLDSVLEKLARRTTDLSGGMVGSDSGRPLPAGADTRTPKPPMGLVCTSDVTVTEGGEYRGVVTCSWNDVSKATNNTDIDIKEYVVGAREEGSNRIREVGRVNGTTTSFYARPGEVLAVYVAAVSRAGRVSAWSGGVRVDVKKDVIPPPMPSLPVVSQDLQVIQVNWDGKTHDDRSMPPDFAGIEMALGASPGVSTVYEAASSVSTRYLIAQVAPGTYYVRIRAVDRAGNVSGWTAAVKIVVKSVVDTEAIRQEFNAQKAYADEIRAAGTIALNEAKTALENMDSELAASQQEFDTALATLNTSVADAKAKLAQEMAQRKSADKLIRQAVTAADNKAVAARVFAEGLPTMTRSTSAPGNSAGKKHDVWWRVDSSGKLIGQWSHNGTAWVDTPIRSEVIANLAVSKLVADSAGFNDAVVKNLVAGTAFAREFYANRIVVTNANLIRDPAFESPNNWPVNNGFGEFPSKCRYMKLTGNSGWRGGYEQPDNVHKVLAGVSFRLQTSFYVEAGTLPHYGARLFMRCQLQDGSYKYEFIGNSGERTKGSYNTISGEVKTPKDTVAVSFGLYLSPACDSSVVIQFYRPSAREMTSTELIVDGGVLARHIKAGEITGDMIYGAKGAFQEAYVKGLVADKAFIKHLYANRIVVSSSNLFRDPNFMNPQAWEPHSIKEFSSGTKALQLVGTGGYVGRYETPFGAIPMYPGAKLDINCEIYVKDGSLPKDGARLYVRCHKKDGSYVNPHVGNDTALSVSKFGSIKGEITIPGDTVAITLGLWLPTRVPKGAAIWFFRPTVKEKIDHNVIVDGGILARHIKAGEITGDMIAAPKGAINDLFVESIVGSKAFIRQFYASRIVVAAENLVLDPNFENPDAWLNTDKYVSLGKYSDGTPYLEVNCNGKQIGSYNQPYETITVRPGEKYRFTCSVHAINAAVPAGKVAVYLRCKKTDGSYEYPKLNCSAMTANGAGTIDGVFTVPANCATATLGLFTQKGISSNAVIRFYEVSLRAMTDGNVLVENCVSANHIKTNTIEAGHMKVGGLDGYTITGAVIQTDHAWNRGVKFNSEGIVAYDNSGNKTIEIKGTGGHIKGYTITGGLIQTSTSNIGLKMQNDNIRAYNTQHKLTYWMDADSTNWYGTDTRNRISLISDGYKGRPVLVFNNGKNYGIPADIFLTGQGEVGTSDPYDVGTFVATGVEQTGNSSGRAELTLGPFLKWCLGTVWGPDNKQGYIKSEGGMTQLYGAQRAEIRAGSHIVLGTHTKLLNFFKQTSAPQVGLNSNNYLINITSARKYKVNIDDIHTDPHLALKLLPRTWADKHEYDHYQKYLDDRDPNTGKQTGEYDEYKHVPVRIPGLVAEEVEDAGLAEFVQYDKDGNVQGVMYDRLWTLLIPLVKELFDGQENMRKSIENLQKQVKQLQGEH